MNLIAFVVLLCALSTGAWWVIALAFILAGRRVLLAIWLSDHINHHGGDH